MTLSVLEGNSPNAMNAIFRICGASRGPSASTELLVLVVSRRLTEWSIVKLVVDVYRARAAQKGAKCACTDDRGEGKATPRMCDAVWLCVMTDVTAGDSGNYTCEVRGRKSAVLSSVTHFVFVRRTYSHTTPTSHIARSPLQLIFRDSLQGVTRRPWMRLFISCRAVHLASVRFSYNCSDNDFFPLCNRQKYKM